MCSAHAGYHCLHLLITHYLNMVDLLVNLATGLLVFVLGSAIGSFINVVVYRLPAGLSILWPPSRCPHCLNQLRPYENVPIFGWLRLRGRCGHCGSPISPRYPIVETLTGLLFVLVFWQFQDSWQTLGYWAFFSWLLALALIDLDTMTLPNPLTQSGLIIGLAFQGIAGFLVLFDRNIPDQLMVGIIGAVVGIWLLDFIAIAGSMAFGRTAMGAGDAKLAAMMGAWLGWKLLLMAGFLACAIGAFAGSAAIALGWLERSKPFPFGPFLAIGAGITALWGDLLLQTYLQIFFPIR